jgi:hypothetical protein
LRSRPIPPSNNALEDLLTRLINLVGSEKNVGNRKGAELATCIVEKGKPLLTEVSDGALK